MSTSDGDDVTNDAGGPHQADRERRSDQPDGNAGGFDGPADTPLRGDRGARQSWPGAGEDAQQSWPGASDDARQPWPGDGGGARQPGPASPDDTREQRAPAWSAYDYPPPTWPGEGRWGSGEPAAPAATGSRRNGLTLATVAVIAALIGGGTGAGATLFLADQNRTPASSSLDAPAVSATRDAGSLSSVGEVAAKVLPSVVSISVASNAGSGTGSGIVVSSDGLVLTNNHVVQAAADSGTIIVSLQDGRSFEASIVGLDPLTDLGLIKVREVDDLVPATLGRSADLRVGDQVVAIGSPLGLDGTVTTGIVSALDRPVRTGDANGNGDATGSSTVIDAIQTDAPINPGNSGGALVNMSGNVIGINSAIATLSAGGSQTGSIGLGFAIPVDSARRIADELRDTGRATHARLGVTVRDAVPSQGRSGGAEIGTVESGSAAEDAGLAGGDIVTAVGERRIGDADALIAAVRSKAPGSTVEITYLRNGDTRTTSVALGSDAASS